MSSINVRGIAAMVSNFNEFTASQAPFAMAKALTDTAKMAQVSVTEHINVAFDRPTAFTKRAMAFTPANKATLKANVYVKEMQASYLVTEMEGGARGFKSFEEKFATGTGAKVALPGRGIELNQYGNISKAKILRIARDVNTSGKSKRFFTGKPVGHAMPSGIYARVNNNTQITPLIVFATAAVYQKRFRFSEVVNETVDAKFVSNLESAWAVAVKSMRR
jgi:hypothetical protein